MKVGRKQEREKRRGETEIQGGEQGGRGMEIERMRVRMGEKRYIIGHKEKKIDRQIGKENEKVRWTDGLTNTQTDRGIKRKKLELIFSQE